MKTHISSSTWSTIDFQVRLTRKKRILQIDVCFELFRYILNPDGSIKSDDESRVRIKCAILTCLTYLSTIDPFAFFDSFDYSKESKWRNGISIAEIFVCSLPVLTYLLSLREHAHTHWCGACANLLAKWMEMTVRLLTISPPISSLTSSFQQLIFIDIHRFSR